MKGIPMKTWEVCAILDNCKTVTRQVIRFPEGQTGRLPECGARDYLFYPGGIKRPPHHPGDILYVRETWCQPAANTYWYKADSAVQNILWRPSIHMPKEAARIFLQVTDVRVERLQEITDDEVEKEGVPIVGRVEKAVRCLQAFSRFPKVWNSTIKPKDRALYGWEADPWVWVIEFERISKEEKTI